MWPWRVKMPTQNLLRLLLLLMLMPRIMLATVCYRFGSWRLVLMQNFCSDFEHKVWSRFWSWSSGKILKLKFGQYLAVDVWLRLWGWILVNILKLGLVKILSLNLVGILMFGRDLEVNAYRDSELEIWSRFVIWTQPSGLLCLWQCFHSLPVHEFWEWFFFITFPFPNFGKWIFHSHSCSWPPKSHSCSPLLKIF